MELAKTKSLCLYRTEEKRFLFLFSVIWTANPFLDLLRGACLHIPGLKMAADYIPSALVWISILVAVRYIVTRIRLADIAFLLGIGLLYMAHYLSYSNNQTVLEFYAFTFLCVVLPLYLVGVVLNVKKFYYYIANLSRLVIVLQFFYVFVYGAGARQAEEASDSMMQAYAILPHLLFVIHLLIKERRPIDWFFLVLGLIQIFSFGNRGSMVALVVFLLLSVLQLPNSQFSKGWKVGITFLFALGYFFMDKIAVYFEVLISNMGMSARLFTKTLEGTFFEDDSRLENYWKPLWRIIEDAPFTGYGIGGDRVVGEVIYAHNIVLELFISFGMFFGALIFIAMCIHQYKGFASSRDADTRSFILVLICSSFLPLFVSGTYLTASSFFLLLGLCTRNIRYNKRIKLRK